MQDQDPWCWGIKQKLSIRPQHRAGGKLFEFVDGAVYRIIDDGHGKIYQLLVSKELRRERTYS